MADDLDLNLNVRGDDGGASSMLSRLAGSISGVDGTLRMFSQGLAGSIGLMPGLTFQSFALRNSIMALGSEAGVVGLALGAGMGLAKGLADAGQAAADFDSKMTIIRNNTLMTDSDFHGMIDTVKTLATTTGSSMEQIAEGFRHASNLGYDFAESQKLVAAGNELAVATGGNVGETTNRLAGIMKDYGISTSKTTEAENAFFMAAAQGNMTLQEFADFSGRINAVTGALGGRFTEVAAGLDALTRHGFTASQAQTQLLGAITHIIAPTKDAQKELQMLSAVTGIDLVKDFSEAGLQTRGFAGILDDLRMALGKNTDEVLKLVPAFRGGQGMLALLNQGTQDYHQSLDGLNEAMEGKVTPAAEAFRRQQELAKTAQDTMGESTKALTIALGEGLQGAMKGVFTAVGNVERGLLAAGKETDKTKKAIADLGDQSTTTASVLPGLTGMLDAIGFKASADIPLVSGLADAIRDLAAAGGVATGASTTGGAIKEGKGGLSTGAASAAQLASIDLSSLGTGFTPGPVNPEVQASYDSLQERIKRTQAQIKSLGEEQKMTDKIEEISAKMGIDGVSAMAKAQAEATAKGVESATADLMKQKAFAQTQVTGLKEQLDTLLKGSKGEITPQIEETTKALTGMETELGKDTALLEHHGKAGGGAAAALAPYRNEVHQDRDAVKDLNQELTEGIHKLEADYKPKIDEVRGAIQHDTEAHNILKNALTDVKHGQSLTTEEIQKAKGAVDLLNVSLSTQNNDLGMNAEIIKNAKTALDSIKGSEESFKAQVQGANDAVKAQQEVVAADQEKIREQQETIKEADRTLTQYKDTVTSLTSALSAARTAESAFISGATEPFNQKANAIQLQIDKIEEADLARGMTLSAAQADPALDKLKTQLDEIHLKGEDVALTVGQMKAAGDTFDFGTMIDQLTKAQAAGQGGLGDLIAQLTELNGKSTGSMGMDEVAAGILAAQKAQLALTQAIPPANAAATAQQAVVDGLNKTLEGEQKALEGDQRALQARQKSLQEATQAQQAFGQQVAAISALVTLSGQTITNDTTKLQGLRTEFDQQGDSLREKVNPQVDDWHKKLKVAEDKLFDVSQSLRTAHNPQLAANALLLKEHVTPATVTHADTLDTKVSPALDTATQNTDKLTKSSGSEGLKGALDVLPSSTQPATDAMDKFATQIERAQADAANGIDLTIRIHTVGGGGGALPGHATGTDYAPGGPSLVGEVGPEIVNLPRGSSVTPVPDRRLDSGGKGSVVVTGNTFVGTDSQVLQKISTYLQPEDERLVVFHG